MYVCDMLIYVYQHSASHISRVYTNTHLKQTDMYAGVGHGYLPGCTGAPNTSFMYVYA